MQIISVSKIKSTKDIVDFIKSGLKEFNFSYDPLIDKDLDDLKSFYSSPKAYLLISTDNYKITGTIGVVFKKRPVAILQRLYIKKDNRRRSLGKLLYDKLEKIIKKRGYKKIVLDTTTRNKEAVIFFKKKALN